MTSTCKLKALFSGEYLDKAGPDVDKISVRVIVDNQSCDHCPSNFDNPEEGNSTHKDSENLQETSDISTQSLAGNSMISCPAIFDFKTCRDANRFKVGQIWALYDKHDAMPRHYAKIMHFDAHNHKIHLTWLEHDATNKEEKWTDKKLPVACGSFRLQPTVDTSQNRFMFSHTVACTKGTKGNSYDIYPNKGEVWALYKGWSMQWSSDTDSHRSCEYELVEFLSNMSTNDGATVIPLVKIKDSVSLFARSKGMSSFFIPSSDLLRFSHSISFYRTNGSEKMGVPRGFLELDTACLPSDLDAAFSSVTLVSYMFLGDMTGCVLANFTTESAANKMDYGDEPITQKENPLLEQNDCHSISTDDTDDISYEQNTSVQKKAHDANELVREDTSTVPNAAGSCDLQMLGKRKHDDCADSGRRRDSCIKRQSKDNSLSDANSTADKMYNDDVAVANTQAAKHVPDTMDSQGEGNATHEDCQQKYKEEATDIANQTHGNPGIAYECTGNIRSRDYCNNDKQRKDNSLADTNSSDDSVCSDNVAGGKNQAAEPVPSTLGSQDEGIQQKYKKDPMDIANHMLCNPVITNECSDYGDEQIARMENSSEPCVFHSISAVDTDDISSEQNTSTQKNDRGPNESGDLSQQNCMSPNSYSYPDPDFHDFEEGRSFNKFKHGQIWAMYSDADKFPNFYAWIRKVDPEPFSVHLTWLEACPKSEQEKWWLEQELSISCGTFEVRDWRTECDTSSVFSYLVDAKPIGMKCQFEVLPQVGQIWATYMNWAPGWVPPSDGSCEYAIGEIIERNEAGTKLTVLTQVGGYRCVFKPDNTKGVLEIPAGENLRFSHCIPSFCLTEEMGGTLRGFYELDPASLPDVFLYRDT